MNERLSSATLHDAVPLTEDERCHVDKAVSRLSAAHTESVTVVIPCFNEEHFIGTLLSSLSNQYEVERYEIVIVDGMSSDRTREIIAQFAALSDVRVRLVDNPARNIPVALNIGIREAQGEIIVRMDAHSIPSKNYVRRCVELLAKSNVALVGMPWVIKPSADSLFARAIACAVSHPFGIGDAKYRYSGLTSSEFVDTVPFGAFRKTLWRELGGFNESLLTNEDYDFHYRVRQLGGRILLDTEGYSYYFARPNIKGLGVQYFRYGRWKAQMVKLHPRSIRWRQVVAPAFVLSLLTLSALSLWWNPAVWTLLAITCAYFALALYFADKLSRREGRFDLTIPITIAFLVIHTAWGTSFLWGLISSPRRQ